MRVGTWNLAGRWDNRHERMMLDQGCDVWLLTEVRERVAIGGFFGHMTAGSMAHSRRWAAILSREPISALQDPHPATAAAIIGDLTFASSVLPWRSCPSRTPWVGFRHADKTRAALDQLLSSLPPKGLVWGGDFNQSLLGKDYSGSQEGCRCIRAALDQLALQVPTEALPHRVAGVMSIDHIAVARGLPTSAARRVVASVGDRRLSDHDLYTVEIP